MIIRDLFRKDINRPINGVVKADQVDNEVVWQELEEYVVTSDIKSHLDKFFSTYCNSLQGGSGAISSNGGWISGFFGSGKSHFLKILAYLLGHESISFDGKTQIPVKFFSEKPQCQDPIFLGNMEQASRVPCDAVLFNIDSK
ncbi:MAG: BREX system P-loop protein BrxC, partial [Deltaproteobacteria bacterium]|nr:BREX system P-loop protein BrxC [Deltaproteobacteria bacterium]